MRQALGKGIFMKNKRYSLSPDDCNCLLGAFYENVAKRTGAKVTDKTQFDCRKICITKSVQDIIWKKYAEEGYADTTIAALMLQYGPKANLDGSELEFVVEPGFTVEE